MSLLEIRNLTKKYGGLVANDSISLACERGQIVGIIGPNGAGKTTLLNCINGLHKVNMGNILLNGEDITKYGMNKVCMRGVGRTFQIVEVVDTLSVTENVMVGSFLKYPNTIKAKEKAVEAISFVGINNIESELVGSLTLAQKRKVEFARALATEPVLILLDELLAGLNMSEIAEMVDRIKQVSSRGIGILWIEHVMEAIMPVAHHIVVLNFGEKLTEGKPMEIAQDPKVISAYLGTDNYVEG